MVNLALGILSKIISKTTPLCTSALANTHLIEFVIYQKPNLVLIRIFVPFLFQNETELEKSQFCTFITKNISVAHHYILFCNSVAADLKLNLSWCIFLLQASPINMDATGCEQAKEICCNVNVWSILVNVILQVSFRSIFVKRAIFWEWHTMCQAESVERKWSSQMVAFQSL